MDAGNYPKAGDPNPAARLGVVVAVGGRSIRWIDTSQYSDFLIVNVGWTPDSRAVVYQVQNRKQTWLDLNRADAGTGVVADAPQGNEQGVGRTMAGLERRSTLAEGRIVSLAQRAQRLAPFLPLRRRRHADPAGHPGDWEVRRTHGVDPADTWIYFASTATQPDRARLVSRPPDGTGLQRLSRRPTGRHQVVLQSVAHALSRFVERRHDTAAGPRCTARTRDVRCASSSANPCSRL